MFAKSCFLEGAIRSLFIHRPAGGINIFHKLKRIDNRRAYGLTECLWAVKNSLTVGSNMAYSDYLNDMPRQVSVAYDNEEIIIT